VSERHFTFGCWRRIETAIFREWVVNVGRREAVNALAHVMCEFVGEAGSSRPPRAKA
jgi:hypothetical protein